MLDATRLLRLYARRRRRQLAREDPVRAQERTLLRLVRQARQTRFGRDHGFAGIASVADFQARVPLRRYEGFWADYWRSAFPDLADQTWPGPVPYLAVTSGTTSGVTKYIPWTMAMNRANVRAGLDVLVHHVTARPASRVLGGKAFMLGGSSDLAYQAPGVRSGDLSGIAVVTQPRWVRSFSYPPRAIALMTDWEAKIDRLAADSPSQDIRVLTGTPSWLLVLFDRLVARCGVEHAVDAYPNLELLIHGGVHFGPYHRRFEAFLAGSHAELREVYPASEGFIAVADRGTGEGLRLIVDNGLFFEFVPLGELDAARPTRHWLATVEPDVNYAVVLSSCAGLWAYVLGDTVRFVERRPPRLLITGRTSYWLSAFGEHLIGEEIEAAVTTAAASVGTSVTDYAVGALFPETPGEPGRHLFVVECAECMGERHIEGFAAALDRALAEANDDYRAHRQDDLGMAAPRIAAMPPGSFAEWMKRRGKLGGQHKVPRVITDLELFEDLRAFAAGRGVD